MLQSDAMFFQMAVERSGLGRKRAQLVAPHGERRWRVFDLVQSQSAHRRHVGTLAMLGTGEQIEARIGRRRQAGARIGQRVVPGRKAAHQNQDRRCRGQGFGQRILRRAERTANHLGRIGSEWNRNLPGTTGTRGDRGHELSPIRRRGFFQFSTPRERLSTFRNRPNPPKNQRITGPFRNLGPTHPYPSSILPSGPAAATPGRRLRSRLERPQIIEPAVDNPRRRGNARSALFPRARPSL